LIREFELSGGMREWYARHSWPSMGCCCGELNCLEWPRRRLPHSRVNC